MTQHAAFAADLSPDAIAVLREDLAAAFRITHRFGWSESVGNHFSAAVSADGRKFLLNPRWQHFATIAADDCCCSTPTTTA